MIVKKLLRSWGDHPAGATVVVGDDEHTELVKESVVDPGTEVRELIKEWSDPAGATHSPGTQVRLDAATKSHLEKLGVLDPTAI